MRLKKVIVALSFIFIWIMGCIVLAIIQDSISIELKLRLLSALSGAIWAVFLIFVYDKITE